MPDELPPLGKFVIASFEANDLAYPVVVINKDNTVTGYQVPAIFDPIPDSRWVATHVFTGVQRTRLDNRVLWTYERLPGRLLTGKAMSSEAQGAIATITRQLLKQSDADYSPDYKTLSYSDTPRDANTKIRDVVKLDTAGGFPVLTDYDQDPEYQSLITTTFEVVDAASVTAPTISQGIIRRFKHIDKWRSLRITEVYAAPADFSEQRFSGQHFPNLFNTIYADDDCGVFLDMRGGFDAMVEIRIDISFGNFVQVSGLTIIPNSFAMFAFRVNDVLNDAMTLSATGNCTYTLNIPASSPSKSTYQGYGSTKQLVTGESVHWKAGWFRTTRLYVKML